MMEQFGLPLLASEHGADVDNLIFYLHILMALLFEHWLARRRSLGWMLSHRLWDWLSLQLWALGL